MLLLSLIVVVAVALWLTWDPRFYIYQVEVIGTARLSPNEVLQASRLSGFHILWVRPAEIEARLLTALPMLEQAQVVCRLPSRCTITVTERQPRVVWDQGGQLWWVDADGVIFPAPSSSLPAGGNASSSPPPIGGGEGGTVGGASSLDESWVVRGPLPRDEEGRLSERVRVALAELWSAGADISPLLYYTPDRGFVLTDSRGWRVIVGQGPGMDKRLQVLEWLAADLQARGLTPKFVDVRFFDAPYYSLTNDW